MTDTPTLVVLGGSPRIARAAANLGCRVALVQLPGKPVEPVLDSCDHIFTVDFREESFTGFSDRVLRRLNPHAIVSLTEDGLRPAAYANEELGLPGVPSSVVLDLMDKSRMRARLDNSDAREWNIRSARVSCGGDAAERLRAWGATAVIVKPRMGTSSKGVIKSDNPRELIALGNLDDHLVEEYIPGPELSVESFSRNGRHQVIAVTEKSTDKSFVEVGHTVPAALAPDVSAAIRTAISAALDALELTNGPAHTEVKIVSGCVKIIESHNRIGGDRITELVRLVTGVDLMSWSLGWPLGEAYLLAPVASTVSAASIWFPTPTPGTVSAASIPDAVTEHDATQEARIYQRPGDQILPLRSSADRIGHVIATADNPATATRTAQRLAGLIESAIHTTPEATS